MLAISLHAVRDDLRNQLVPINKRWPILKDPLDACRAYPRGFSNAKRITFPTYGDAEGAATTSSPTPRDGAAACPEHR